MAVTKLSRLVFAGVPLLRRAPATALVWGLCLFPISLLTTLLSGLYDGMKGPWADVASPDLGEWLQFGVLFANLPVMCIGMAILAAAVFRAVADPDRADGRWMRFGSDEIRLCLVWCMMLVVTFIIAVLIVVIGAVIGPNARLSANMDMLIGVSLLAAALLMAALLAPFGLAPVMTVFERRVAFADSSRLTRGRYGVAITCTLTFMLFYGGDEWLLSELGRFVRQGAPEAQIGSGPFVLELARYAFKPENLVPDLARVVVGTVCGVIAYAPLAVLYRDLTGRNPADQAAVFD
jgi:hypothetical protein